MSQSLPMGFDFAPCGGESALRRNRHCFKELSESVVVESFDLISREPSFKETNFVNKCRTRAFWRRYEKQSSIFKITRKDSRLVFSHRFPVDKKRISVRKQRVSNVMPPIVGNVLILSCQDRRCVSLIPIFF